MLTKMGSNTITLPLRYHLLPSSGFQRILKASLKKSINAAKLILACLVVLHGYFKKMHMLGRSLYSIDLENAFENG